MATRGRPPKPLDRDSSSAAYLGAELRARRQERELTQKELAALIGFSPQHVSEVERAKTWPTQPFIAACDRALDAQGRLLDLLPAVAQERATQRDQRAEQRRYAGSTHSDAGDDDVKPTNRRGLLGAGAAATLGAAGIAAAPAAARKIDPELPSHCRALLSVLGRHDAMCGPHEVLAAVGHQIAIIAEYREVARGELRVELMREESRWSWFASWLAHDAGDVRLSDSWADRALRLAREIDYHDMIAWMLTNRSQWAATREDPRQAVAFASAAGRTRGVSTYLRALCALRIAHSHALAGDAAACECSVADAHRLLDRPDASDRELGEHAVSPPYVLADEARCWLQLRPQRAITLYEAALREWPRDRPRGLGIQRARLALTCAAAGERDRAKAEGRKAFAIAKATNSVTATRELKRLGQALAA
jgi:transcriptional regulator with XRE-family HTH domain